MKTATKTLPGELPSELPDDVDMLKQLLLERESLWRECGQTLRDNYQSLLEQWRLARHKQFGASSEASPGQGELFDEAEQLAAAEDAEQITDGVADETAPAKQRKTRRSRLPENLPRERVVIDIDDKNCDCCGGELHQVGEETSEKLEFIPARIKVIEQVRPQYGCRTCEREGTAVAFQIAPVPPSPIPKSIATPSLLAQIISAKFQYGLPLYRQESMFQQYGIELSRKAMSIWMLRCAELLSPVYRLLHQHLLNQPVLWADETTLKVVEVKERSKCYMWVYGSGADRPGENDLRNIVLYDYQGGREHRHPVSFLSSYQGYLQVDGYAAYEQTGATLIGCMAHARRRFKEAQIAQPKGKTGKADWALNQIQKLYRIETEYRGQPPNEIQRQRQQRAIPLLDQLKTWLEKSAMHVPPKSLLGKAIHYTLRQWPKLVRYVDDGRLNIDNNRAERAIKPFVIGRKNWMFSNTENGASASATLYSLVESAKANGVVPFDYLSYLLSELPKLAPEADLEHLMPWNVSLPASPVAG
jgi:transposase